MSSATGIRLSTARWKDLGTYHLILPPEQHYVKYRHNGKHSGSDVAQLKKVRNQGKKPGQSLKIGYWTNQDEENNNIVTRSH